ncbi:PIH1 domain-containing protein 1-like [Phymastichus coffea]|uniref:PIH1 domain-containing protein 1-like n=1 Tax=Phymastichus coffea TaxID=108790 RepID=UPI00273C400D|nr:PIH1 domain-containing protein 1-like [Phymastichus coffea]
MLEYKRSNYLKTMNLDIDTSVINTKLRFVPDESGEPLPWLHKNMNNDLAMPYKKIDPFPGACIKTWTDTGDKVFINVCHSKEILAPEDISDEKFSQLMIEEVPGFIIPMAIGTEKMAKDKEDIERATYDILVNTSYFEKCMKKPHFWQFTVAAILESINDKYKKNINTSKHIVLKNKKVTGSLDTFTIEDRKPRKPVIKKTLIQELDSKEIENLKKKSDLQKESLGKKISVKHMENQKQGSTSTIKTSKLQNYIILKLKDQKSLIALFYLPSSSITDLTIDIGVNRIIIENEKAESIVDLFLPHNVDNNQVVANYDNKLHILRLHLALKDN